GRSLKWKNSKLYSIRCRRTRCAASWSTASLWPRGDGHLDLASRRFLPEECARRMAGRSDGRALGRLAVHQISVGGGAGARLRQWHSAAQGCGGICGRTRLLCGDVRDDELSGTPLLREARIRRFAALEDYPPGHTKYYLRKQLAARPTSR